MRSSVCPQPRSVLGIPQIDHLLEIFRYPVAQTPQRSTWAGSTAQGTQDLSNDDEEHLGKNYDVQDRTQQNRAAYKPAVIEVTSSHSASGKTHLLYLLAGVSIVPKSLGGHDSTIIWIDNDGRFTAGRLLKVVQHHLQETQPTLSETETRSVVEQALSHVHVFRPQSSDQLIAILNSLPTYLLDRTIHASMHRPLGLIILDPATAFYWQDRFEADMARLETRWGPQQRQHEPSTLPSKPTQIIIHLKSLQARFQSTILFTTNRTNTTTAPTNPTTTKLTSHQTRGLQLQPPIPSLTPWTLYATLTLVLNRLPVPQFAPQMTLQQCLHDAQRRLDAVQKGRFSVGLDWVNAETWAAGVRERLAEGRMRGAEGDAGGGGHRGTGGFVLRIVEEGVVVED